jgi:ATP-dependent DNA helicase RecG
MIDIHKITEIISRGEAVNREFKSDSGREFTDKEIYEEIVAMANTDGGVLLIGVEDDGTVSGSRSRHGHSSDPNRLQSAIFNNTRPNVNTRISVVSHDMGPVIAIEVDSYPDICATASGKVLRRIIGPDGKPATIPMYPHDQRSRRGDLGLLDFSAQLIEQATFEDLNPLEFERLRQTLKKHHGDLSLLELSDKEIVKGLRLAETRGDFLVPNIAGLLLLGHEESVRKFIPTHMVHFQVLDSSGNVKVNDDLAFPLIKCIEEVESRFLSRLDEEEVMSGMYRIPIPAYHREGFREVVNNALLHRDYSRMGAVFIQWYQDHMLITNPGGFPVGITLANILVHEPKPRNERLADAFKRIGLVEKTGRGVDRIYLGQLWYGRPAPDYSRSDATGVRLILHDGPASHEFTKFVIDEERAGRPFLLDDLIVMNTLLHDGGITPSKAGELTQRSSGEVKVLLQALEQRGVIIWRPTEGKETYSFSPAIAQRLDTITNGVYPSLTGADRVVRFIRDNGRITRREVAGILGISDLQARDLLIRMKKAGIIQQTGTSKRTISYVLGKEE